MDSTVLYNRGVLIAALHVEALRNAIKAKGGATPTSEEVKKGMESVKGFTLGGLVPPMEITAADLRIELRHELHRFWRRRRYVGDHEIGHG
jgi:branched-chain amino acid transport system substrate-binding protein